MTSSSLDERNGPLSTERPIDILIVNTFQKEGGAARAAFRTFRGVKRAFPKTHYSTLFKEDNADCISGLHAGSLEHVEASKLAMFDQQYLEKYLLRNPSATLFTPGITANPLRIPLSQFSARLIHLHWVAHSMLKIEELSTLHVPIVWTLHDAWAFTGGCHYTGSCDRYTKECGECPQLGSSDEEDISRSLWRRKRDGFETLNLTITSPSRWLADIARKSSLLQGRRIEVIPNGLDTDVFRPCNKKAAKEYFGVNPDEPVLLSGSQWLPDYRKGGDLIQEALAKIDFACTLFLFGSGTTSLVELASEYITVRSLGLFRDDISLALLYSAADVFICGSREDNLPNTVAEAFACGTPCVAFNVGGIPEMIDHQVNGWLAKALDPTDLASGIKWLATHPYRESLQAAARRKALLEYSLAVTTPKYAALYHELLDASDPTA